MLPSAVVPVAAAAMAALRTTGPLGTSLIGLAIVAGGAALLVWRVRRRADDIRGGRGHH